MLRVEHQLHQVEIKAFVEVRRVEGKMELAGGVEEEELIAGVKEQVVTLDLRVKVGR